MLQVWQLIIGNFVATVRVLIVLIVPFVLVVVVHGHSRDSPSLM